MPNNGRTEIEIERPAIIFICIDEVTVLPAPAASVTLPLHTSVSHAAYCANSPILLSMLLSVCSLFTA